MATLIALRGVKKIYDGREISYLDLCFEYGKSYIVLGASGVGKSTLLNLIAGVINASEGDIFIDGINISKEKQSSRDHFRTNKVGYIYQDFKLIEDMTVEDNIRILELCGIKSIRLEETVLQLGLQDKLKRKVRTLSGGEKQRVAIARAVIKDPMIILADEPTGSLHEEIGDAVIENLIDCAKGKLIIVVSHNRRLTKYFDVAVDLHEQGGSAVV